MPTPEPESTRSDFKVELHNRGGMIGEAWLEDGKVRTRGDDFLSAVDVISPTGEVFSITDGEPWLRNLPRNVTGVLVWARFAT